MDKKEIVTKIGILKKNLIDSDYQAIKYAENEITIEKYMPIKEQRKQWRIEINTLEKELNNILKS